MQQNQSSANTQNTAAAPAFNMNEWESSVALTEKQQRLLQRLEELERGPQNTQQQQIQQQTAVKKAPAVPGEDDALSVAFHSARQVSAEERQHQQTLLKTYQAQAQNQLFVEFLGRILADLQILNKQFADLQKNKEFLLNKINTFYSESLQIIQQQKRLLELQQNIKEFLSYYDDVKKLRQEIEHIQFDMNQRNAFEGFLQRFLSQIIDGIVFFAEHRNFQDSEQYLFAYVELKNRLMALVKSFLFKILNREFAFINSMLSRFLEKQEQIMHKLLSEYDDFFTIQNESEGEGQEQEEQKQQLQQIATTGNVSAAKRNVIITTKVAESGSKKIRKNFLVIIFPQFARELIAIGGDTQKQQQSADTSELLDLPELFSFELNTTVRNLISFIATQTQRDEEIFSIYTAVFLNYLTYCRLGLHKEVLKSLEKVFARSNEYSHVFLSRFLHYTFEVLLCEFAYTLYVFNFQSEVILQQLRPHWQKIVEQYYEFARPIALRENLVHSLFAICGTLQNQLLSIEGGLNFSSPGKNFPYAPAATLRILLPESKPNLSKTFIECYKNHFLTKLLQDAMQKLIHCAQAQVNEQIVNFNVAQYVKKNSASLVLQQASHAARSQREDYFPAIVTALDILLKLHHKIDENIFKQMAADIVKCALQKLYEVSQKFAEKFDAYIFLLKNMLLLSQRVIDMGMDFLIQQQELDFSETKSVFLNLVSGNLKPSFNLKDFASNFFNFLYKGLPKLNEFTIDVKQDLLQQLKNIFHSLNKDMTFIISKNLIDFIRRYQNLNELLNENEQPEQQNVPQDQQAEPKKQKPSREIVEQDLQALFKEDLVVKTYSLFIENLFQTSHEMKEKLANYLPEREFEQIAIHVREIQQNSLELLLQFYIILSKHVSTQDYEKYGFESAQAIRERLFGATNQ